MIIITTNHPASKHGAPVCLIDGELVTAPEGFIHCCKILGWNRAEASEKLAKSVHSINAYRRSKQPHAIPAEVWITLGEELKKKGLGILDIG